MLPFLRAMSGPAGRAATIVALAVGILLRLHYVALTPLAERSHDTFAHTDYVEFVMREWRVPPAHAGWEFHQPPLYYFVAAGVSAVAERAGYGLDGQRLILQWVSALLSVLALCLLPLIAAELFADKRDARKRALFTALGATLPGLVFFASRVSNDALLLVTSYALLLLLLRWWRTGSPRTFGGAALAVGIGMLAKLTSFLHLPIALVCVALRKGWSLRRKAAHAAGLVIVAAGLTGWLFAIRLVIETDTERTLHLGSTGLHPDVLLPNEPANYLTFRPLAVIEQPYNHPWKDEFGRQYFWEYFFKSWFFGEWMFPDALFTHARLVLVAGMGLFALAVVGCVDDCRRRFRHTLPMLATLLLYQAASLAFRYKNLCSCHQDFRFVPLLALPAAYYAVRSRDVFPKRARWVTDAWVIGSVLLFAAFVLRGA
jgi:hypothetical protein